MLLSPCSFTLCVYFMNSIFLVFFWIFSSSFPVMCFMFGFTFSVSATLSRFSVFSKFGFFFWLNFCELRLSFSFFPPLSCFRHVLYFCCRLSPFIHLSPAFRPGASPELQNIDDNCNNYKHRTATNVGRGVGKLS